MGRWYYFLQYSLGTVILFVVSLLKSFWPLYSPALFCIRQTSGNFEFPPLFERERRLSLFQCPRF